jgi:hypothetical protein
MYERGKEVSLMICIRLLLSKKRILTVTFSNGFSSEFHPDILFEDKFKTSNFLKQRNAFEGMD